MTLTSRGNLAKSAQTKILQFTAMCYCKDKTESLLFSSLYFAVVAFIG